jgi:hypothetical protein
VQATTARPKITVTTDGAGVVSHAGTRLLADLADATTLTEQFSQALQGVRGPRARHDPGRVLVDLAVAIADGAASAADSAPSRPTTRAVSVSSTPPACDTTIDPAVSTAGHG